MDWSPISCPSHTFAPSGGKLNKDMGVPLSQMLAKLTSFPSIHSCFHFHSLQVPVCVMASRPPLSSHHSLSLLAHCRTQDFVGLWRFVTAALRKGYTLAQTSPALEALPFCGMRCVCSPELPAPTGVLNSPTICRLLPLGSSPQGMGYLDRTQRVSVLRGSPGTKMRPHPILYSLLLTEGSFPKGLSTLQLP